MAQLTDAPPLEHLTDLTTGWHHVCTARGVMRQWQGGLTVDRARITYQRLVERGQVITVQHRVDCGHYRIFAKMVQAREPKWK